MSLDNINKKVNITKYGGTATTLGQKVKAASIPVALASDSDTLAVSITQGTPVNEYAENSAVTSSVSEVVVTYTVPVGKTFYIQGFSGSGTATARFRLRVGGTVVGVVRTSTAQRSNDAHYDWGAITAGAGIVVDVLGFHEQGTDQSLESNIFGYII